MSGARYYLDPGGKILVSADRHATALPVVLAGPKDERIAGVISTVERANGSAGFAAHVTGSYTLDRAFTELSASDLSKGELQFGLPAALVVLLLVVGTLTGAAIPMLMAIISIVVALGVTAVIGQAFPLNLFVVNMVVAMGLAPGIDYWGARGRHRCRTTRWPSRGCSRCSGTSPAARRTPSTSCSTAPRTMGARGRA